MKVTSTMIEAARRSLTEELDPLMIANHSPRRLERELLRRALTAGLSASEELTALREAVAVDDADPDVVPELRDAIVDAARAVAT